MEQFIRVTLTVLATVLAATGLAFAGASLGSGGAQAEDVAIKRDEEDVEAVLARDDDGDGDDEDDLDGQPVAAANGDASRSNDRSRDATSSDRSNSLDRSLDRTGDRVGALDRSNSRDFSGDRTGDHNSRDVSNSLDMSADDTSVSNGGTGTNGPSVSRSSHGI